jgi:hypothetical protein
MTKHADRPASTRTGSLALVAAGLALALAAQASADPVLHGRLEAREALVMGPASFSGPVVAIHMARDGEGQTIPSITVEGATVSWTEYVREGSAAQSPEGSIVEASPDDLRRSFGLQPRPTSTTVGDATFETSAAQEGFTVHVYALNALAGSGVADSFTTTSLDKANFDGVAGVKASEPQDVHNAPDAATFHSFDFTMPLVRTDPGGSGQLEVEGDFVVEFLGVSGTLTSGDDSVSIDSGTWRRPVASGAPDGPAYAWREVFVRMVVHDGSASIGLQADAPLHWGGPSATFATAQPLLLEDAQGAVTLRDGTEVAVHSARYVVDGDNAVVLTPAGDNLGVAVTAVQPPQPDAAVAQELPSDLLVAAGLAVVALAGLAAGSWLLQRRLRRVPTMAEVEAELGAGRYGRAAAMAGRILRREPGRETALISRAVALARAGRNARVVAEVEEYLKRTDPSDGVLHYVLGVAYHDLGQTKAAEAAFGEAVSRTPSLLPQVEGRLTPSGSRPPTPFSQSPAETHGYA